MTESAPPRDHPSAVHGVAEAALHEDAPPPACSCPYW
jgi:hypothetical protein